MNGVRQVAFLVFEHVEELDLAGPWQVLTTAGLLSEALSCYTVAEQSTPLHCAKGLVIVPDHDFTSTPKPDILVVPGGRGVDSQLANGKVLSWIAASAKDCEWVTSVCSGALLLLEAGPARGRRITTHWNRIEQARKRGQAAEVIENVRYVQDGNLVTSAGVSAGIDMALWLTGQLFGPEFARRVQHRMEYDPSPPYADKNDPVSGNEHDR